MISLDRLTKGIDDFPSLLGALQSVLSDLEDQFNASTFVFARNDQTIPNGTRKNDVVINADNTTGTITLQVSNGKSFTSVQIPNNLSAVLSFYYTYKGYISQASDPSTTNLPSDGDWGFFKNTAASTFYIARNFSGTVKKAAMI